MLGSHMRVAVPSGVPGGLGATVSPRFDECEVFTVVDVEGGSVESVDTVENQTARPFVEVLASRDVEAVVVRRVGAKVLRELGRNGVAVFITSARDVEGAVLQLVEGETIEI